MRPPPGGQREELWSKLESYAQQVGMSTEDLESLTSEIDSAVANALENLAGASDPRPVVADTIAGVLEENGIDPENLQPAPEEIGRMGDMSMPIGVNSRSFGFDQVGSWFNVQA
jgi:Asp-tRNA(Asn)/Glu-tRNA(Gln) amidotransferase B subunit